MARLFRGELGQRATEDSGRSGTLGEEAVEQLDRFAGNGYCGDREVPIGWHRHADYVDSQISFPFQLVLVISELVNFRIFIVFLCGNLND